jgi:hypothetical protein
MPFLKVYCFLVLPLSVAGQDPIDTIKSVKAISFVVQKGSVFIHKPAAAGAREAVPFSAGVDYFIQQINFPSYHYCSAFIRTGFSLNYTDFKSHIIGKTITAAKFIEPVYRLSTRLQYQFRAEAGFCYATSPYDPVKNSTNQTYSTHINTYLHFSTGIGWRLSDKIIIDINGHIHHISNGNFKQPNAGLNWLTFSGAVLYYPTLNRLPKYTNLKGNRIHRLPQTDAGLMFTPGQEYHPAWKTKRNYMAGLFVQVSKVISRINAITAGTELSYDRFRDDISAPYKNSSPALKCGINIGNEFLLGRILASQQLGYYISHHPSFYSSFYHRWGIRYRVSQHMYAGFSLKVHKEVADFVDMRLQYRF